MSGTQFPVFTDASPIAVGTTLNASILDCIVLAQGCLVTGGIPLLSGTLILAQPVTVAIVNTGTAGGSPTPASQSLTFTASKDTYVDLAINGTYTLAAVANNASAPALTASSVRLYKAISNTSAVTAIQQLAPNAVLPPTGITFASETSSSSPLTPTSTLADNIARIWNVLGPITGITQTTIQVDATEADTDDSLSGGSLLSNLDRIRYTMSTLLGLSSWQTQVMPNAKEMILVDGTNSASPALAGTVTTPNAPTATANHGVLNVGPDPFSGSGSGHFVGLAAGTELAVNAASAFAGNLLGASVAGVQELTVNALGQIRSAMGTLAVFDHTTLSAGSFPFQAASEVAGASWSAGQIQYATTSGSVSLTAGSVYFMGVFIFQGASSGPRAVQVAPADLNPLWEYGQMVAGGAPSTAVVVEFLCMRSGSVSGVNGATISFQCQW